MPEHGTASDAAAKTEHEDILALGSREKGQVPEHQLRPEIEAGRSVGLAIDSQPHVAGHSDAVAVFHAYGGIGRVLVEINDHMLFTEGHRLKVRLDLARTESAGTDHVPPAFASEDKCDSEQRQRASRDGRRAAHLPLPGGSQRDGGETEREDAKGVSQADTRHEDEAGEQHAGDRTEGVPGEQPPDFFAERGGLSGKHTDEQRQDGTEHGRRQPKDDHRDGGGEELVVAIAHRARREAGLGDAVEFHPPFDLHHEQPDPGGGTNQQEDDETFAAPAPEPG